MNILLWTLLKNPSTLKEFLHNAKYIADVDKKITNILDEVEYFHVWVCTRRVRSRYPHWTRLLVKWRWTRDTAETALDLETRVSLSDRLYYCRETGVAFATSRAKSSRSRLALWCLLPRWSAGKHRESAGASNLEACDDVEPTDSGKVKFKVKVTLRLTTVSQSVCLGVEPNLRLLTRDFLFSKLLSCLCGAPSLTRGRVCHLSVFCQYSLKQSVSIYIVCVWHSSLKYNIYKASVSSGSVQ
jgi:hypothetical protein